MSGCFRDLPPVLDPCCGSRMFYFNDHHPSVLFCDNRDVTEMLCDGRMLTIRPDVVSDVTALPFEDEAFPLVVFDPHHLFAGSNGWQAKKYGTLPKDWREWMTQAFSECWRVLASNGTLIFKWFEYRIPLSEVLECAPTAGSPSKERYRKAMEAKEFFMRFLDSDVPRIAVENPRPMKIVGLPEPSQTIQPYAFGDPYSKATHLWLRNLPPLMATLICSTHVPWVQSNTGAKARGGKSHPGIARSAKERSKTFPGIAQAMADQWGPLLEEES